MVSRSFIEMCLRTSQIPQCIGASPLISDYVSFGSNMNR